VGGVGLGFISFTTVGYLRSAGVVGKKFEKITFSLKLMLSCLPQDNLVKKKEDFRGLTREGRYAKTF
jgi:hypothetical protein